MTQFPSRHKEGPSLCHTHIPQPSSTCILGSNIAFSLDSLSGSALLGSLLAFLVLGCAAGQSWEGPCPRSCRIPAPATLPCSTAALSYKILCCSNLGKKPRAVHAGSSSACNDCRVMDLHGENFELLSALKPCSLRGAANEMCWLPLPVSRCRCWLEQGRGAGSSATLGCAGALNYPWVGRDPQKCLGSVPGVLGLPAGRQQAPSVDAALSSSESHWVGKDL